MPSANPIWNREELTLALDLYLRRGQVETSDPEVQRLSDLLNRMPRGERRSGDTKFRNPNGVHMKLGNFMRIDPNYRGKGLSRGNKLEQVVWDEFAADSKKLEAEADRITALALFGNPVRTVTPAQLKRKPILLARVGWMSGYAGLSPNDPIQGGGQFVANEGYGFEMFNFRPFRGQLHGYVEARGRLNLRNLGAPPKTNSVDDVTVVWVARAPGTRGGTYVVGWYGSSTVYAESQSPDLGEDRMFGGEEINWNISSDAANSLLLDPDARDHQIPTGRPGAIGQSNVFYPLDKDPVPDWVDPLVNYISKGGRSGRRPRRRSRPDNALIRRIESSAITVVTDTYSSWGWDVRSVETQYLGWDLEATKSGEARLLIEVKGTRQSEVRAEISPNEYTAMTDKVNYRLCVVTDALDRSPLFHGFTRQSDGRWRDAHQCVLDVQERTGARISCL